METVSRMTLLGRFVRFGLVGLAVSAIGLTVLIAAGASNASAQAVPYGTGSGDTDVTCVSTGGRDDAQSLLVQSIPSHTMVFHTTMSTSSSLVSPGSQTVAFRVSYYSYATRSWTTAPAWTYMETSHFASFDAQLTLPAGQYTVWVGYAWYTTNGWVTGGNWANLHSGSFVHNTGPNVFLPSIWTNTVYGSCFL
jgi:hypothetical protein